MAMIAYPFIGEILNFSDESEGMMYSMCNIASYGY
jgi:hypothetical protein